MTLVEMLREKANDIEQRKLLTTGPSLVMLLRDAADEIEKARRDDDD